MPYERLEPCEGKLSRTVLRGGIGSDVNLLPDHDVFGSGGPDSGDHYSFMGCLKPNPNDLA